MRVWSALGLGLMIASPGSAFADLASCKALFARAPASIAGVAKSSEIDHEAKSPGSGYQARYRDPETRIVSLIFYDEGQNTITQELLQAHWRESTQVIGIVAQRANREVKNSRMGTLSGTGALSNVTLVHMQQGKHEYLAMGVRDNCMIKMRLSLDGETADTDAAFLQIIGEVDAHLEGHDL